MQRIGVAAQIDAERHLAGGNDLGLRVAPLLCRGVIARDELPILPEFDRGMAVVVVNRTCPAQMIVPGAVQHPLAVPILDAFPCQGLLGVVPPQDLIRILGNGDSRQEGKAAVFFVRDPGGEAVVHPKCCIVAVVYNARHDALQFPAGIESDVRRDLLRVKSKLLASADAQPSARVHDIVCIPAQKLIALIDLPLRQFRGAQGLFAVNHPLHRDIHVRKRAVFEQFPLIHAEIGRGVRDEVYPVPLDLLRVQINVLPGDRELCHSPVFGMLRVDPSNKHLAVLDLQALVIDLRLCQKRAALPVRLQHDLIDRGALDIRSRVVADLVQPLLLGVDLIGLIRRAPGFPGGRIDRDRAEAHRDRQRAVLILHKPAFKAVHRILPGAYGFFQRLPVPDSLGVDHFPLVLRVARVELIGMADIVRHVVVRVVLPHDAVHAEDVRLEAKIRAFTPGDKLGASVVPDVHHAVAAAALQPVGAHRHGDRDQRLQLLPQFIVIERDIHRADRPAGNARRGLQRAAQALPIQDGASHAGVLREGPLRHVHRNAHQPRVDRLRPEGGIGHGRRGLRRDLRGRFRRGSHGRLRRRRRFGLAGGEGRGRDQAQQHHQRQQQRGQSFSFFPHGVSSYVGPILREPRGFCR